MNVPTPTITVDVDPTNPGQFFACCGILELAQRLWPATIAEGWFAKDGGQFQVACGGSLEELLAHIQNATLISSVGQEGLKQFSIFMNKGEEKLNLEDRKEYSHLKSLWQTETITLTGPFNIPLNWWWDTLSGISIFKTWAGKQIVFYILEAMQNAIRSHQWEGENQNLWLSQTTKLNSIPLYFDSDNNAQTETRDCGFSLDTLSMKLAPVNRPLMEMLAFIGMQRFRPAVSTKDNPLCYYLWTVPVPTSVAAAFCCGVVSGFTGFRMRLNILYRTKYLKALSQSQLY